METNKMNELKLEEAIYEVLTSLNESGYNEKFITNSIMFLIKDNQQRKLRINIVDLLSCGYEPKNIKREHYN